MVRIDSNFFATINSSGLRKNSQTQEAQQTQNPLLSFKSALQKDIFEKKAEQLTNENQAISDKLKAFTAPVSAKANQISQKAVAFAGSAKANMRSKINTASTYITPLFNKEESRPWKLKVLNTKSVDELDQIFKEAVAK